MEPSQQTTYEPIIPPTGVAARSVIDPFLELTYIGRGQKQKTQCGSSDRNTPLIRSERVEYDLTELIPYQLPLSYHNTFDLPSVPPSSFDHLEGVYFRGSVEIWHSRSTSNKRLANVLGHRSAQRQQKTRRRN